MASADRTVVFVHGLWLHADSWTPGSSVSAPRDTRRPRPAGPATATVEETRNNPSRRGLRHRRRRRPLRASHRRARTKPIVIGHSFGGLIAQRLLGQDLGRRRGRDRSRPDQGRRSTCRRRRCASHRSRFGTPRTGNRAVSLTEEQFRYGFGNALSAEESEDLYQRWTIPSPGKPLFEAAIGELLARLAGEGGHPQHDPRAAAPHGGRQGPHGPAAIADRPSSSTGSRPPSQTCSEFPDRGHSLDDRQRLARGGRRRARLARRARPLAATSGFEPVEELPTEVTLHVGERRSFRLPGLAQAGYRWRASIESGADAVDVETSFDEAGPAAAVPGRPFAAEVLSIVARAPGTCEGAARAVEVVGGRDSPDRRA